MTPNQYIKSLLVAMLGLFSFVSSAAFIPNSEITPTTELPQFAWFDISQIVDGITSDIRPYNGFAADGVTEGQINFAFSSSYNISGFTLWNDINIGNTNVGDFTLSLIDSNNNIVGQRSYTTIRNIFAGQYFDFGTTFTDVSSVKLDIMNALVQIEIREVAFTIGEQTPDPNQVSEPVSLGVLGLVLLLFRRGNMRKLMR